MTTSQLLHPLRQTPSRAPLRIRTVKPSAGSRPHTRHSWERPALLALLALTALAYIWDLSASGWANSFYAAAVQAGTKSWKAMFFGSLDSSNFITVDKPPASLWVMELSARIFGFSSWSILVPQALEGVAAVGLLFATVRRRFGAGAGLIAGAVLALTPVAALMFRFDNPDALLVLLLVAGAYCMTRALERAGTRWILAAGTLVGFAFLAKMMQAFLVLPAFALVYAYAAPTSLRRRLGQLLAGAAALAVSAGWWVAIVALWPASSRPFIDGSPDNSILNLIFEYNGLDRVLSSGAGPGAGAGGGGGSGFSGPTGILRLFDSLMGGQASWLLPAALLALLAGLWATRRRERADGVRAALLLWGGWLIVTGLVFSFGEGVIHTYYTVALAPAIGALVGIGAAQFWRHRHELAARLVAALAVAVSAGWSFALLERTPSWLPWLRVLVAIAGALAVAGLLAWPALGRARGKASLALAVLGAIAMVSGPLAYAADTVTTPHTGSVPSAGPRSSTGFLAAGGPGGARASGRGFPAGGAGSSPGGGAAPAGGAPSSGASGQALFDGGSTRAGFAGAAAGGSGAAGAPGGGGAGTRVNAALVKALREDARRYRWAAATSGSQSAASLELASDEAVMAIGGFSGQGGRLSLSAFEQYVARGEIHYYLAGGGAAGPGGRGGASAGETIASWVAAHFKAKTIGGETVYDLTQAAS
jgi:4-amino-4-deoxy-L-arabinose transferase-like glycosyltransferase